MCIGTYRDLTKECDNSILVKDRHITIPELILSSTHLSISSVLLLKVQRLEKLKRSPAMVHVNVNINVSVIIAIHSKTTRLSKSVDDGGMGVEVTVALDGAEADLAGCFEGFTVEDYFVDGSVVIVEACEGADHAVGHGAIEACAFTSGDLVAKILHLLLGVAGFALEGVLMASIFEADYTGGVLLQTALVLSGCQHVFYSYG
jgi:hypothetical protein